MKRTHRRTTEKLSSLALMLVLSTILTLPRPAHGQDTQQAKQPDQQEQKEPKEGIHIGTLTTTGSVEFGWRQLFLGGSRDYYRSTVNLDEGLRLFGLTFESRSPENTGALLDYLAYDMNSWGGDPYNTARLRAEKRGAYRFDFTYSRLKYYNFLPTFANPLLGRGVQLGQHSADSSRRQSGYNLTIFPDSDFKLHFAYDRNTQFGTSLTTFPIGLDEFVLFDPLRTTTDDYRAGVDFRIGRVRFTLEQGFRAFKNDIHTNHPPGQTNIGNNPGVANPSTSNPQPIVLTSYLRNNGVRGFVPTTRFGIHSHLFKSLLFTGRFVYSDANIDFNRSETATGNLFDLRALRYFSAQSATSLAQASRPNAIADTSVNYRPHKRFTFTDTTRFNHFTIAGGVSSRVLQTLGQDLRGNPPPANQQERVTTEILGSRTFVNSVFNQFEGVVEVTPRLNLRAGHRFTHRRVSLLSPGATTPEESTLNTNAFVGGVSFRAASNLRFFSQVERGSSDNVFTRVAPYHFTRLRIRTEYRPTKTLTFSGQGLLTDSRNPNPFLDNVRRNRGLTLSTFWTPNDRLSVSVSYSRSDITSFINIIHPRLLTIERSTYIANDNYVDGDVDFHPLKNLRVAFGYSVVNSQGTYPLNYHQPRGLISYNFPRRLTWTLGWRWWGYNEKSFSLQDYRAHTLTSSLKISF